MLITRCFATLWRGIFKSKQLCRPKIAVSYEIKYLEMLQWVSSNFICAVTEVVFKSWDCFLLKLFEVRKIYNLFKNLKMTALCHMTGIVCSSFMIAIFARPFLVAVSFVLIFFLQAFKTLISKSGGHRLFWRHKVDYNISDVINFFETVIPGERQVLQITE